MTEIIKGAKRKLDEFLNDGKNDLKKIKRPKDLIKQIPNLWTISRLFLIPFIISNLLIGNFLVAGILTLTASLTDLMDGFIARKLNATSKFGKNLDALVDKIFIISISIPLLIYKPFLIAPIILDLTIAGVNGYAHIKGYETKSSFMGKIKTVFLDSLIISVFFNNFTLIKAFTNALMLPTIILQGYCADEYLKNYLKQKNKESKQNNPEIKTTNPPKKENSLEKEDQNEIKNLKKYKSILENYEKRETKKKTFKKTK